MHSGDEMAAVSTVLNMALAIALLATRALFQPLRRFAKRWSHRFVAVLTSVAAPSSTTPHVLELSP